MEGVSLSRDMRLWSPQNREWAGAKSSATAVEPVSAEFLRGSASEGATHVSETTNGTPRAPPSLPCLLHSIVNCVPETSVRIGTSYQGWCASAAVM